MSSAVGIMMMSPHWFEDNNDFFILFNLKSFAFYPDVKNTRGCRLLLSL